MFMVLLPEDEFPATSIGFWREAQAPRPPDLILRSEHSETRTLAAPQDEVWRRSRFASATVVS
jgi:hypothetical protein